jgi:hypothetical protein
MIKKTVQTNAGMTIQKKGSIKEKSKRKNPDIP